MRRRWPAVIFAGILLLFACSPGAPQREGLTVESLGPNGAGTRSGLRVGDVLLSWRRAKGSSGEAAGVLHSCADLAAVEIEEAPLGPVAIQVKRGRRTSAVTIGTGEWQVEALPHGRGGGAACTAFGEARRLVRAQRWPEARAAFDRATAAARRRGTVPWFLFASLGLREQGNAAMTAQDFPGAEQVFRQALSLARGAAPRSLHEASAWHALGRLQRTRGDVAGAETSFVTEIRLRQQVAPQGVEIASAYNNLGIVAWTRSDPDRARKLYEQALALIRARAAGSLDEAQVLNNLGLLALDAGDLTAAERTFNQAGAIWQRLDPQSLELARNAVNLGAVASDRGDLARSEEYLRVALLRFERIAPESLEVAHIFNNLGIIARDRYELTEAEALFRHALAIRHRLAPGSEGEAASLSALSWVARERGRLDEAEAEGRAALAIRSRLAPRSRSVAISLGILGAVAMERGNLKGAAALAEQALALDHQVAPGSLDEGMDLQFLSEVEMTRGELQRAESLVRQALAIRRRLAPGSRLEGETLDLLGMIVERQHRIPEAEAAYTAAAAAEEAQIGRLGGSDAARSSFQVRIANVYRHLVAVQVVRGETAAALYTLERSRARALLAMFAERDLTFAGGEAPAALIERQRRLDKEYEKTQEALARLDPRHREEVEAQLAALARLRGERAALASLMVQASPHYASLRAPQPLGLPAIRALLDPGTVWLSFCVGDDQTFLFVVSPQASGGPGLEVHTLPIGRDALADEVSLFRGLLLRGRTEPTLEPALLNAGRSLFDLLLAPAASAIATGRRILLSPDGPLHILPFAALVRPDGSFVAEDRPLHSILSATLYAEIRRGRHPSNGAAGPLVAFADPQIPRRAAGVRDDPGEPPLRRYRRGLDALPGAHSEVRALAALWGGDAHLYVGAEATEQQLRHLPVRPRFLHFACHALLDRRFPLDSALALASPSRPDSEDNGLLQAWEIFERLRVDADLVTLSACETGLGRDAGGDGLIGLTRAFQYAGARSILASLWSVSDLTTAELMERFYTLLRSGLPKDRALQEAQRALLHGHREAAHPVHWAAFTLSGDWR